MFYHPAIEFVEVICGRTGCGCKLLFGEAEVCWYCGGPLCAERWERVGHCGHAEAEAANEAARSRGKGEK
mgnify:CR=1 FL=1